MPSFENKKELRIIITLSTGKFGNTDNNRIVLEGFRASVDIDKGGGQMAGTLRAAIYGVSQDNMNSITTLQWGPRLLIFNTIEVYAIDGAQETLVFQGNIVNAWGNYNSAPDVFLQVQAQSAYFNQLNAAAPSSYKGSIDAATLMGQLAAAMGYTFENNGVSVQLSNPYLPNTLWEQAKALAVMANCDIYLDDPVLAITPSSQPRKALVPEISPQTGLIGYPTFDGVGVNFESLFNPGVTFGGAIQLVTSISRAAGMWVVASISYKLESEKPGGAWFSRIRANQSGLVVTHG